MNPRKNCLLIRTSVSGLFTWEPTLSVVSRYGFVLFLINYLTRTPHHSYLPVTGCLGILTLGRTLEWVPQPIHRKEPNSLST